MLAALDRSSYLAMKVLMNQLLNQAPTGPNAFTNGGIMAYTGPCRDALVVKDCRAKDKDRIDWQIADISWRCQFAL